MPAQMVIELRDGDKILFGGDTTGMHQIGALGDVAKATGAKFEAALGQLGKVVGMLHQAVERLPHKPDKVEVELRASMTSECNLWIVSGDGEAEFKVKLAWGRVETPAD